MLNQLFAEVSRHRELIKIHNQELASFHQEVASIELSIRIAERKLTGSTSELVTRLNEVEIEIEKRQNSIRESRRILDAGLNFQKTRLVRELEEIEDDYTKQFDRLSRVSRQFPEFANDHKLMNLALHDPLIFLDQIQYLLGIFEATECLACEQFRESGWLAWNYFEHHCQEHLSLSASLVQESFTAKVKSDWRFSCFPIEFHRDLILVLLNEGGLSGDLASVFLGAVPEPPNLDNSKNSKFNGLSTIHELKLPQETYIDFMSNEFRESISALGGKIQNRQYTDWLKTRSPVFKDLFRLVVEFRRSHKDTPRL